MPKYDVNFRPETWGELQRMPREHLVEILDSLRPRSPGGLDLNDPKFWYAAIQARDQELLSRRLLVLTVWIAVMTGVYTVATIVMLWITARA